MGYMKSLALPMPVGVVVRAYNSVEGLYKDILRLFVPGKIRRYLFKPFAFPCVLATPFLFLICCKICCGGDSEPSAKPAKEKEEDDAKEDQKETKKQPAKRSASPGNRKG